MKDLLYKSLQDKSGSLAIRRKCPAAPHVRIVEHGA